MIPIINKTDFVQIMENVQKCDKFNDDLNTLLKKHGADGFVYTPDCVDDVIFLLMEMFNDSDMLISNWCFELDYGKGLKKGSLRKESGDPVDVKDVGGLYDYLVDRMSEEGDTDTQD